MVIAVAEKNAHKTESKEAGFDFRLLAIGVVVLAILAGAYLFLNKGAAAPPETPTAPLEAPSAKLLLSAFTKGAALTDYDLAYETVENGVSSKYGLMKKGVDGYVSISGTFGSMEGYFGADNRTDIACLTYNGERKCAQVGNHTDMEGIAASLRILLPNKKTYVEQQTQIRDLIGAGAIKVDPVIVEEKFGGFDTSRVSYTLDYRGLTVDQMLSLGISPSDPQILAFTDQKVSIWVDKQSGLMVRSLANYKQQGVSQSFEIKYSHVSLASPALPTKPDGITVADSFVLFFDGAQQDFSTRLTCLSLVGSEKYGCLKAMAAQRVDWEVCKLIADKNEYESCTVIVAGESRNRVLCEKLEVYADDCYIAVAGATGNSSVCQNLKNASLASACANASVSGARAIAEEEAAAERMRAQQNCAVDLGCKIFGNAGQYCAPANSTKVFASENSTQFACLKGVPCKCNEGFCGFAKNESYYSCVSAAETAQLRSYIDSLVNQTSANSTGSNSSG